MASSRGGRNSNSQLLDELETLSQTLYQSHTSSAPTRRTASLVLPRSEVPPIAAIDEGTSAFAANNEGKINPKPRVRRLSLSPWKSRPDKVTDSDNDGQRGKGKVEASRKFEDNEDTSEKKGIWKWKPIRALSHIGMQKLSCLFSVEVVAVQNLPASMNGLRLSVSVRKKETKDGAVQTMPSRVSQGAADFEETLFIRCHVYYTPAGSGTQMRFEPRPFLIYVFAVDADELDFGRSAVDLSKLIQESVEKSLEGSRIRQWDISFNLSGKAKGGDLVLKLGVQIMEKDGGIGIYSQAEGQKAVKNRSYSSIARRQSKASFSVPSPRMSSRTEAWTPSQTGGNEDLQGIDELNLDEPAPPPPSKSPDLKPEEPEELEFPEFEVVDKGVEMEDRDTEKEQSEEDSDKRSASSEVVKEMVNEQVHQTRLTELDSIAQQIKALETMMEDEKSIKTDGSGSQILDAEEETVTRDFLQMLQESGTGEFMINEIPQLELEKEELSEVIGAKVYIPDLGKGLGCVVQTRNGGYLAAMNPLNTKVLRKDTPKLAVQISKPFVLPSSKSANGFELFQMMAVLGPEGLGVEILPLMPMEELMGKTAEQIAFEGIASAIIQGRNTDGASSSAARTIASVKSMASAMSSGRKERISTGIWNVSEDPLTADDILAFSLQKIEAMAIEALKIQADITDEESPFDVSPLKNGKPDNHLLASATPLGEWIEDHSTISTNDDNGETETISIFMVIQLRDPSRQYESVGGPMMVLIQATHAELKNEEYDDEKRFKLASLHVGGLRVKSGGGRKNNWDSEKERLTAVQWLVAYGLGKAGKKGKLAAPKKKDVLWSISSRIMADMWLKHIRNPDIRFIS